MNPEQFKMALQAQGIDLSETQAKQFHDYYELLVETNEHVNLTTITEEPDVYLKHFYDSVSPAFFLPALRTEPLSLVDVGAGAGFPSIPLKILFPQLKVSIVDSLNKRITFLNQLAAKLNLTDVAFHHARAEEFGNKRSDYRERYDMVTARAVARMSVLAELCLPLVKTGGQFVALKAAKTEAELDDGTTAIHDLGGKLVDDFEFKLPESGDERHIVVVDKVKQTAKKYPRKPGEPARSPLGS